jgi:acyl carrier protein
MKDIEQSLRDFIRTNFYVPDSEIVPDDASLRDLGIVDSTGVLEVVLFLEREHGVTVADAELLPQNLDSIAAIAAFVRRKRSQKVA